MYRHCMYAADSYFQLNRANEAGILYRRFATENESVASCYLPLASRSNNWKTQISSCAWHWPADARWADGVQVIFFWKTSGGSSGSNSKQRKDGVRVLGVGLARSSLRAPTSQEDKLNDLGKSEEKDYTRKLRGRSCEGITNDALLIFISPRWLTQRSSQSKGKEHDQKLLLAALILGW